MARTSILTGGSNSAQITSEDLNAYATDFMADGVVGTLTNTSGVAPMTGGLALNSSGSANGSTTLTAGICYVTATPTSQGSQRLRVKIDGQTIAHAANSTGGTRYDWVYVKVDAALAANPIADMSTTGTVVVSRSTSSSSDDGTPPTYGKVIHKVTIANGFTTGTTVTDGSIADVRTQTNASFLTRDSSQNTNLPSAGHISLTAGTSKLVKTSALRQDNTTNTYKSGTVVTLYGWGFIAGNGTRRIVEAVTFGVTFTAAPVVIVSQAGVLASSDPTGIDGLTAANFGAADTLSGAAYAITTTGFNAEIGNANNTMPSTNRYGYAWQATGEIA